LAKTVGSSLAAKVESVLTVSFCALDCSIVAAWVLADEASTKADKLLEQVMVQGAIAPSILSFEIMNVLIQTEKRGWITSVQMSAQLNLVGNLPIHIVSDPS
jgi:predicted nucleic acid-binding protein